MPLWSPLPAPVSPQLTWVSLYHNRESKGIPGVFRASFELILVRVLRYVPPAGRGPLSGGRDGIPAPVLGSPAHWPVMSSPATCLPQGIGTVTERAPHSPRGGLSGVSAGVAPTPSSVPPSSGGTGLAGTAISGGRCWQSHHVPPLHLPCSCLRQEMQIIYCSLQQPSHPCNPRQGFLFDFDS